MNNPLLYLIRKMWQYAGTNRKYMVLYLILSALANLLAALEPLIVGLFLNKLQSQGFNHATIIPAIKILAILPLLEIGFWALHGTSRVLENRNAFIIRANYKNYLLQGTMALPLAWHTDHHSGDTIDKIEKGTSNLFSFSSRTFEIMTGVIRLVTSFTAMFFYDVPAGLAALIISAFTFYTLTVYDKRLIPGYKILNGMENTISAKVFDALSNVTTVIILRIEKLVGKSLDSVIQKPLAQYMTNNKINELKWFSASLLGRLTVVIVVSMYLVSHVAAGTILVGTIYILYGYANQIRDTFFKFAYLYNDIVRYRTSVTNAEELSNDFSEEASLVGTKLKTNWRTLGIDNLSFSYHAEDGADLHLDSISMKVEHGQRIALIGDSGGGKSTFLKVLRDVYSPKTLTLTVDGKTITEGFSGISEKVSLIPQDPEIFTTTIRENITLGVDYPEKIVLAMTDIASFTPVVQRLPHGFESSIVEKGVNLSGGEKQRLALSRGLLASRDKDIILLDEPTSSVDFHNELTIYKNIFKAFPDATIFSSVHRLHLLSLFDIVYFFKDGKILARGTFSELQTSSREFKKLWQQYIATRDKS